MIKNNIKEGDIVRVISLKNDFYSTEQKEEEIRKCLEKEYKVEKIIGNGERVYLVGCPWVWSLKSLEKVEKRTKNTNLVFFADKTNKKVEIVYIYRGNGLEDYKEIESELAISMIDKEEVYVKNLHISTSLIILYLYNTKEEF